MMLDRHEGFNDMEHDPTADRNREPSDPDNNMNVDENIEEEELIDGDDDAFDVNGYDDEEFGPQEFSALNNQLDQLQSALDSLESRNDDIHSKLLDLLRSSREIRQVMSEESNHNRVMEVGEAEAESTTTPVPTNSSSNSIAPQKNSSSSTTCATPKCDDSQSIPNPNVN